MNHHRSRIFLSLISAFALSSVHAEDASRQRPQIGWTNDSGSLSDNYDAGIGLSLTGWVFSIAPPYRLPQGCSANQIAQWSGSAWICGAMVGTTMPTGTVNQTLRYDASGKPVANNMLQSFADGGLLASGAVGTGNIPATGDGARLMWYPGKAAFRVGAASAGSWEDSKIGQYSLASGNGTIASGVASTAGGVLSYAFGEASTALGTGAEAYGAASIALGTDATASADYSRAIGFNAIASQVNATAIGRDVTATGYSSIAMGALVNASGDTSIAMGYGSVAGSDNSIAIGNMVAADGPASTAMGMRAQSGHHKGSFIYGDASRDSAAANDADNQFMVVADGGIKLFSKGNLGAGVQLASGSGSWTALSDRNAKTALQLVDGREVLKKVIAMPLSTWQYKTQSEKYRHMGPMAQDFYAAFRLGESDKGIDTVDADGVALAAIQGLSAVLMEKDERVTSLRDEQAREIAALKKSIASLREEKDREIASLRAELAAQTARVASLESLAADLAEVKAQLVATRRSTTNILRVALHP